MSKSVPERWLEYKAYGDVIKGTSILAFKVPLKEDIGNNLQPDQRFTTSMLLQAFPQLKCIVDLTNTNRYYNKEEFTDAGVKYQKIMVPGKCVPTLDIVKQFFKVMDDFASSSAEGEIIGIHCTHGVNRTGYLICRYLIQQLGWELEKTLKAFEEARGYPIERDTYLSALKETPRGEKIDLTEIILPLIDRIPVRKVPVKSRLDARYKPYPMGSPGFGPRPGFPNGGPFLPFGFGFGGSPPRFGPMPPPPPGMPPGMPRPPGGPPMFGPRPMRMGPPPMRPAMPPPPPGPGFPGLGCAPRMLRPPRMLGPPRLPGPPARLPPPKMPPPPPPPPPPRPGVVNKRLQTQKKKQMRNGVVMPPVRNPSRMIRRDGPVPVSRILPKVLKEQDFTVDTFEENLLAAGSNVAQSRRRNKGRFNQSK